MNILFIMYPWERVDPASDSTLRLIHECVHRGHQVALTTGANLTIRDSVTMSFCRLIEKRVKVINDAIAIRPMAYMSLTFDHRILDGASADGFLSTIKQTIEEWGTH